MSSMPDTAASSDDDVWVPPSVVKAYIRKSTRTLARMGDDGKIGMQRTAGGQRRYRLSDVRARGAK